MDIKLTQFSHGGGCGCKIAPAVLTELLADTPLRVMPKELIVGTETADDAAVYKLNEEQAIVATTDFFTPIVDDPYDFGRIAATNAISDIYAMGGRPIMALAVVGMPLDKLPLEVIRSILAGGESVCAEAGIPIAGGHSIDVLEPIYGLVALGLVHPQRVKRNSGARAGDVLILGKPLGVGILSAALKKGLLTPDGYATMIRHTTKLNTPGTRLAELDGVHALTDVTGFGLAGHLLEICRGSQLSAARALRRPAADPRGGRLRQGRHFDRRVDAQLERLRRGGVAAGRRAGLAAEAPHRSADQRRTARRLRARGGAGGAGRAARRRFCRGARHRPAGGGCARAAPSPEQRLQDFPDVVEDDRLGFGNGVDVVGQEQLAPLRHAFEQEGHQRRLVAARQFGIALLEGLRVVGAVVGRQLHAGQHDARLARAGGIEHGLQVVAHGRFTGRPRRPSLPPRAMMTMPGAPGRARRRCGCGRPPWCRR
jgi:selenide,water dikinase